ncbi:MAG: hypothetical protein COA37_09570 [Hoeflea sp.]|uniref:DUF1801 domain-containing protein n=1 Tax=Hoeflea sp. TaxID=1940281 RepID=UPI000C100804|nr:DUF1801 domain-containing protein [Hoeflea sp.]PHR22965.1 MAG: hypothetical protein COA37_09570 [Hoeflea sp.]
MAENKTQPTSLDPDAVIAEIADETRRRDVETLDALLRRLSGSPPVMWGPAMFGYGTYQYKYASGRQGEFFRCGFASRSRDLVVYLMSGFGGLEDELDRLGPHKTGKSCLYLKKLDAIDMAVLERMLAHSLAVMAERYPA